VTRRDGAVILRVPAGASTMPGIPCRNHILFPSWLPRAQRKEAGRGTGCQHRRAVPAEPMLTPPSEEIMRKLVVALLALFLGACDNPTEPAPVPQEFTVTLSGPVVLPGERYTDSSGRDRVRCIVQLTAQATGGAALSSATWSHASLSWYRLETGELSSTTEWDWERLFAFWNVRSLNLYSDDTHTSRPWQFISIAPFRLTIDFFYSVTIDQPMQKVSHTFSCE
jgi:hypothetical protein